MPSSIAWTDSVGAASLDNVKPEPATRFSDWVVNRKPIGPGAVQVPTGRINRTEYRRDDTVSFVIHAIPEDQMSLMARLQYHLLKGGEVELTGDRELAADFATCVVAPGTEPDYSQSDPQMREYEMTLTLKAVASA